MTDAPSGLDQAVSLALTLSPIDKVRLVEQVMATLEQDLSSSQATPNRSLYGLWSQIDVSDDDLKAARDDMWGR